MSAIRRKGARSDETFCVALRGLPTAEKVIERLFLKLLLGFCRALQGCCQSSRNQLRLSAPCVKQSACQQDEERLRAAESLLTQSPNAKSGNPTRQLKRAYAAMLTAVKEHHLAEKEHLIQASQPPKPSLALHIRS